MYEAFYGFDEKPFSMLPDPGFLYLSKKHQAALTLLEYGLLNHVGFCVISGEPGAGKTTILRAILERIGDDVTVGLITNTHQSFGGLLDWVLSVFDLHRPNLTHVEMHQIFMDYLIEEYANNRTVLLIVDEAQNMNADALEELRMLSNVNSEKDQLLQVVLAGQPALKEMLRRPELMQFAQRIAVDYHLDPLSLEETCGYIQHRLVTAGATRDVFTPAACERIHTYSGGTPRLINLLCETVLVYGFADQREMIDVDMVDEMVRERMKDSVVPIVNREMADQVGHKVNLELEKNFPRIRPQNTGQHSVQTDEKPGLMAEAEAIPEPSQAASEQPVAAAKSVIPEQPDLGSDHDIKKKQVDAQDENIEEKTGAVSEITESQAVKAAINRIQGIDAAADKEDNDQAIHDPVAAVKGVDTGTGATAPPGVKAEDSLRKRLLVYGAFATLFGLLLIAMAILLDEPGETRTGVVTNEVSGQQSLQEMEKTRLWKESEAEAEARIEAEELARIEERRLAREAAAQQAAKEAQQAASLAAEAAAQRKAEEERLEQARIEQEKAALAAKAEQERLQEEQKRIAREKALEARYKAERAKRKAEKLAEEKRLKDEAEARRLELEWFEQQRKALLEKE